VYRPCTKTQWIALGIALPPNTVLARLPCPPQSRRRPFTFDDPCMDRGASVGHDPRETAEATKAVKEFLTVLWKLKTP